MKQQPKQKTENGAELVFLTLDVQHDMNFVEIMKEGWLFSFAGALDFTDKNG